MKNVLLPLLLLHSGMQLTAQCLQLHNCPVTQPVCDETNNDAQLWNEIYWWDAANQIHDLSDAPSPVSARALDACPGATISADYLLFLDLDADGVFETVIKSWEPPAPGTVQYNNAGNPNYNGGETRTFDQRPVPAGQKYQFALETTQQGDTLTAQLRWSTPDAPGVFVDVQLPTGYHKIKWLFENNQNDQLVCEYGLLVKDCARPAVVCLNGLSVNIMPTGEITLWASDFLQYMTDNQTPPNLLQSGIRKSGTGIGFPENGNGDPVTGLTFDCTELGTQTVELWARDVAGNVDFCETFVVVQDNFFACNNGGNDGAPTVVCLNGLSANVLPTEQVQLWAVDFLQYVEDDNTPADQIVLGIRKTGTGSGFPEDGNGDPIQQVIFNCDELGTQTIELWARDLDGNTNFCQTYAVIQDNNGNCGGSGGLEPPKVVCLNGLSVNIMPTGQVQLWAPDFLQYVEDDITPVPQIQLSIRKTGTGTGFPVDGNGDPVLQVVFDCTELGTRLVELWAKDLDGMADYCETYVVVQDNMGNCNGNGASITACLELACSGGPLLDADIVVDNIFLGEVGSVDENGCALFPQVAPEGTHVAIAPVKDDAPINGVSVFDLIKIKRFILGLDTEVSPYTLIAADANKSGSVTGFDIIELRKLLLGIYSELPNNTSWRFIDANFVFPNPQNPFQSAFPETITIPDAAAINYSVEFKAIKIGDLDCDAWPGLQAPSDARHLSTQYLNAPDIEAAAGAVFEIPVSVQADGRWEAIQFGMQLDPEKISLLDIIPNNSVLGDETALVFHQPSPGTLRFVWLNDAGARLSQGQNLFTLRVKALKPLRLSENFTPTSQFENLGSLDGTPCSLALRFLENNVSSGITAAIAPQPNPTVAGAVLPLQLAQSGKVQLEIAEPAGRLIWSQSYFLDAGSHPLNIPAQAMPQAGIYTWRLRTQDAVFSGKLVRGE